MTDPNSMTGYDAATRRRNVHLARCFQGEYEGICKYGGEDCPAEALRALPIAPPAPLQVTADDVALIEAACKDLRTPGRGALWGPSSDADYADLIERLARRAAPPQVTADDVRQCTCNPDDRNGDVCPRKFAASECALARHAAPAVDHAELDRLREAAKALIADVRARHPGEDLRCPRMIALDAALNRKGIAG